MWQKPSPCKSPPPSSFGSKKIRNFCTYVNPYLHLTHFLKKTSIKPIYSLESLVDWPMPPWDFWIRHWSGLFIALSLTICISYWQYCNRRLNFIQNYPVPIDKKMKFEEVGSKIWSWRFFHNFPTFNWLGLKILGPNSWHMNHKARAKLSTLSTGFELTIQSLAVRVRRSNHSAIREPRIG